MKTFSDPDFREKNNLNAIRMKFMSAETAASATTCAETQHNVNKLCILIVYLKGN